MAKKVTKTGKDLEQQVADAYRAIGARKVEHDVELAGHQIDVYVELGTTAEHSLHRIAVEAKDHAKPVGIRIVREFADVVNSLRRLGHVDEGVIVSSSGFSRQARNAAKEHSLRLLEPAYLEAMASKPDLAQMHADYLAFLRQRFEYLDLGGIAPRVQNHTVKLRMEDVFIPVQERAAEALGKLGDARAVEPLLARLEDEYEWVRERAAEALGKLGDVRAVEPLLARLEDEERLVRDRAHKSLIAILNHNAPSPEPAAVPCEPQTVPGPWDS